MFIRYMKEKVIHGRDMRHNCILVVKTRRVRERERERARERECERARESERERERGSEKVRESEPSVPSAGSDF